MECGFLGIICGAIILCCTPSQCQERTRIIKMVVLLPSNRSRLFSIQRVYPALELGMERVVSDDILPSYNLSLQFGDSKCSIADGMNEAIGFYAKKDVDVFFGPCCDYAAAPVGRQTRYWDKPMVTAGAMARDFGLVKKRMFPLMTRVGTTFDSLVEMVMTILNRFHWSKVKLIYNPDGQAHIVDRFCHIVTDGIHHGLRTETEMGIFNHKYRKFHRKKDILDNLDYELGNSYGRELPCYNWKYQDVLKDVDDFKQECDLFKYNAAMTFPSVTMCIQKVILYMGKTHLKSQTPCVLEYNCNSSQPCEASIEDQRMCIKSLRRYLM